jgi:hypothetical protein
MDATGSFFGLRGPHQVRGFENLLLFAEFLARSSLCFESVILGLRLTGRLEQFWLGNFQPQIDATEFTFDCIYFAI